MKAKPKTKRMTFAQFKRRCLHAYARYWGTDNWEKYATLTGSKDPCRSALCRWWRDGSTGDEWNDCIAESAPLYIGGMATDSAGRIGFDTSDGTQWDLTPTLAPMNNGYYDYEVDYSVSEIVPAT